MERPTMLLSAVVEDILTQHSLPASKDVEVIRRRVEAEGESFLTLTLPQLGSALEAALEKGFITRSDVPNFGHDRRGTLPRFLKGLFQKVFSEEGRLRPDADADAIYGIRQICYWLKKPKAECSDKRMAKAVRKFRDTEEDLKSYTEICSSHDDLLRDVSDLLWVSPFKRLAPEEVKCYHGPGATAERLMNNERLSVDSWYLRSEAHFPSDLHLIPNWNHVADLEGVRFLSEDEELPVRVVLVPKTMKTPRVIAIEPSCVQYMQQGLMRFTVKVLESHDLCKRSIRFADQAHNRHSAQRASINQDRATLDLSDASDRVHNELVRNIFKNSDLGEYLQACRSSSAILPDSETPLKLVKFASMGSAMCFPVEAMVFYTVIQVALHYYHKEKPSYGSIRRFSHLIDVYGDDIIVPTYSVGIVCAALEAFGLKVNKNKSFSKGLFRESCGGDYYQGTDVTPVYLRHRLPSSLGRSDVTVLESLVETSNQLYLKGLWKACQALRDLIEKLARTKIPRSPYQGDGIKFLSRIFSTRCRWANSLSAYVQQRIVTIPIKKSDPCTDRGKWYKAFLYGGENALDFDRSVKRGVFKTKRRWINAQFGIEYGS